MLSLEKCKDILEKNGGNYSIEEIKKIRDYLHSFTILGIEELKRKIKTDESNNIHKGINRRAS